MDRINTDESEENAKNHLRDFLNDTGYKGRHLIATKGRADLVIHSEQKASSPVSMLFEVKRPRGKGNAKSVSVDLPFCPTATDAAVSIGGVGTS